MARRQRTPGQISKTTTLLVFQTQSQLDPILDPMKTLLEAPAGEAEMVDTRDHGVGVASQADQNPLAHGSPVPLWREARAQAINFRHNDLVRTHWQKLGRSMLDG